jgi:hypothetical protein
MLSEIFLACLPDFHNAIMSRCEAPLLLGLVCSRWRSLVYSNPVLWASLHIPFPPPPSFPLSHFRSDCTPNRTPENAKYFEVYDGLLNKHLIAVQDWLNRSGSRPLSISFHVPIPSKHEINIRPYLKTILRVSHRWQSLEMTILPGNVSRIMASIPTASVPVLENLRLKFPSMTQNLYSREDADRTRIEWKNSTLLNAPQLRTLDISCKPFFPIDALGFSWSRLSSLNLICSSHTSSTPVAHSHYHHISMEEAFNILSRCPRLAYCALEVGAPWDPSDDHLIPMGQISLPFLESLVLVDTIGRLSPLFERFSNISQLRGISYQTRANGSYSKASPLITLLTRTNNQITYLSIDFGSCTLIDLSTIFKLVPNLVHLIDEVSTVSSGLYGSLSRKSCLPSSFNVDKLSLELLAPCSSGEIYCPRLQTLRINRPTELSDANLLSVLQSRMGASKCSPGNVEPLREFQAVFSRPMELDIRAQLSEYIDNGPLKLSISYNPELEPSAPAPEINPRDGLMERAVPDIIRACRI